MAFYRDNVQRQDGGDLSRQVALGDIPPNQVIPQAVRTSVKIADSHLPSANYTLAAGGGTWDEVDSANLAWEVVLSGAPLEVELALTCGAAVGSALQASIAIDGVEVTGGATGMIYVGSQPGAISLCGKHVIDEPGVGRRRISVVWQGAGAGTITIYGGASGTFVTTIAREL